MIITGLIDYIRGTRPIQVHSIRYSKMFNSIWKIAA